jgi:hypothetical protein
MINFICQAYSSEGFTDDSQCDVLMRSEALSHLNKTSKQIGYNEKNNGHFQSN